MVPLSSLPGPHGTQAGISLDLDPNFSPPASIPSDPTQLVYNAPAMDHMLEVVKVRVLDDSSNLVTEPVTVIATTILASNWNQQDNPGDTYNGTLCMHNEWTSRYGTCRYNLNNCEELYCNTTDTDYPLGKIEVISEEGVATFPRLLHTEPSVNGQRRLRFYAEVNGTNATVVTNPFDVDCKFHSILCHA